MTTKMYRRSCLIELSIGISTLLHMFVVGLDGAPPRSIPVTLGSLGEQRQMDEVELQLESLKQNLTTDAIRGIRKSNLELMSPHGTKMIGKLEMNKETPRTSDNSGIDFLGEDNSEQSGVSITLKNSSSVNDLNLDLDYTPKDIAEYIFWTGDERGVAWAMNDFLQDGIISKEDAIHFLEEVKSNLENLKSRYSKNMGFLPLSPYPMRNQVKKDPPAWWGQGNTEKTQNPMNGKSIESTNKKIKSQKPLAGQQQSIRNALDGFTDYEELLEKVGQSDSKFREYSLEEVIYHLAKELFSIGLERNHEEPQQSIQRFAHFIEQQGSAGKIPKDLEKSILDTLVTALVDSITEKKTYKLGDSTLSPSSSSTSQQQTNSNSFHNQQR